MRFLSLLLIGLLAGCSSDQPPNPYQQPALNTLDWSILFSTNMPKTMVRQNDGTIYFDFPASPGSVHYIVQAPKAKVGLGQIVTINFKIVGDGVLSPTEQAATAPNPNLRLFLWQKGDDLTAAKEFYRWWSNPGFVKLVPGEYVMSVKLAPDQWSSVLGKMGNSSSEATTGFTNAVNNLYGIGFTFGGMFFGHGVYLKSGGSSRFILIGYEVS